MDLRGTIIFVIVGGAAGWLAGRIVKGRGPNLVTSLIVGVVGAVVGGFLFERLGVGLVGVPPLVGSFVAALVGSLLLIALLRFVKRS